MMKGTILVPTKDLGAFKSSLMSTLFFACRKIIDTWMSAQVLLMSVRTFLCYGLRESTKFAAIGDRIFIKIPKINRSCWTRHDAWGKET